MHTRIVISVLISIAMTHRVKYCFAQSGTRIDPQKISTRFDKSCRVVKHIALLRTGIYFPVLFLREFVVKKGIG